MATYAHLGGLQAIENVAWKTRNIILRIRDERQQGFAHKHPLVYFLAWMFIAFTLGYCLTFMGVIPPERVSAATWGAASFGAIFGLIDLYARFTRREQQEISDYLYLLIMDMQERHRDFEHITLEKAPMTIHKLSTMMERYLRELEIDFNTPAKAEFLRRAEDGDRMFSFYPGLTPVLTLSEAEAAPDYQYSRKLS